MRGDHIVSVNENRGNVDHLALRLVPPTILRTLKLELEAPKIDAQFVYNVSDINGFGFVRVLLKRT